jgi:transcriptional regulator GlxA family with amidase domain
MIYGYARCSTNEDKQDIQRQVRELKNAGAESVYLEYEHGDAVVKQELSTLLENAKEGLDAFLKLSNYSRTQLWRLSLKYLNVTPTEFINNVRMKHAYNLIAYTNMSFEAISVEVGFSSFSHFIKLIKETYGTTPLKLRKKLQS